MKIPKFLSGMMAAIGLAPIAQPKVGKGPLALPAYFKSARPSTTSPLTQKDRRLATTDLTTLRSGNNTNAVMRDFVASSPDLSSSVFAYTRAIITGSATAVAKNMDGTFNPDATALLQQLVTRFNLLPNYENGYASTTSMTGLTESLVKELMQYGAIAAELVLDKSRLPTYIQPLSVTHIKFYPDGKGGLMPKQELSGNKVDLDTPCFFYAALDQDLLEAYASSPLEPALQPSLFSAEFLNDIRRVVQNAIHPRVHVTVDEDKLLKSMPPEAAHDPEQRKKWTDSVVESIRSSVTNLAPEEALVTLSSLGINLLNNGNISLADEYKIIRDISDAKVATGAKTLPAILGHGTASSNIASTETMLFVRYAQGLQAKVNEFYSRIFTLGLRLFGMDVTAEFAYEPIDLRPDAEMEPFRSTKQARVLELLSLGLLSDEEASITLTGHLPPAGYKKLSGTMFKSQAPSTNTNPAGDSNGGSTLNQNLNSGSGAGVKGQNKKADPQKASVVALPMAATYMEGEA